MFILHFDTLEIKHVTLESVPTAFRKCFATSRFVIHSKATVRPRSGLGQGSVRARTALSQREGQGGAPASSSVLSAISRFPFLRNGEPKTVMEPISSYLIVLRIPVRNKK